MGVCVILGVLGSEQDRELSGFHRVAWSAPRCLADVCERLGRYISPIVTCSRAYVSVCVHVPTAQRNTAFGGRTGYDAPLPLSPFQHAQRLVKDREQAEGQQIDYPACMASADRLDYKQRPLSVEALKGTRADVIIRMASCVDLFLCFRFGPESSLRAVIRSSLWLVSCYVTSALCSSASEQTLIKARLNAVVRSVTRRTFAQIIYYFPCFPVKARCPVLETKRQS